MRSGRRTARPVVASLLAAALFAARTAMAADPDPSAATLGRNCIICHNPAAEQQSKVPPLARLGAAGIVEAMQGFKTGQRHGSIMERIAKGYSEAEIERMAGWLATPEADR